MEREGNTEGRHCESAPQGDQGLSITLWPCFPRETLLNQRTCHDTRCLISVERHRQSPSRRNSSLGRLASVDCASSAKG